MYYRGSLENDNPAIDSWLFKNIVNFIQPLIDRKLIFITDLVTTIQNVT